MTKMKDYLKNKKYNQQTTKIKYQNWKGDVKKTMALKNVKEN